MEKVQQESLSTRPENSEELSLQFEQSPTRCPYCHDSIDILGGDWVACGDCLARHHGECHSEHSACASCGSVKKLVSEVTLDSSDLNASMPPARMAGMILLIQSIALLFGTLFHMNGQLISGLQWTTGAVFIATLMISVLAFFRVKEETLQRILFRLGLTNAIYLGIGIQVVFALYLWDIGSPNDPKTWAWLSGILSFYSALQSHRIYRLEQRKGKDEEAKKEEDRLAPAPKS